MEINKVNITNFSGINDGFKKEEIFRENKVEQKTEEKKYTHKELDSAVDKANKVLFKNNTHLKFQVHEKTKDIMVKVIDDKTGETLKEFPPEKILDMVAKLWEIAGIFVDEKR
ncbi:flagellar protein FlaG [Fervidicella metallireducens AeB]|uniref:Flagellar protein FlaG n=1 Tax=Fervidicella metallireducens AeB TaxID=1403537 RepID=A0A017RWK7_9CLOT|nr:flagellar protein FlaG [Fervidicella metallireducens]EYE88794.1 flagellar protein FlaG [Fervidicella metallireducens AeB]